MVFSARKTAFISILLTVLLQGCGKHPGAAASAEVGASRREASTAGAGGGHSEARVHPILGGETGPVDPEERLARLDTPKDLKAETDGSVSALTTSVASQEDHRLAAAVETDEPGSVEVSLYGLPVGQHRVSIRSLERLDLCTSKGHCESVRFDAASRRVRGDPSGTAVLLKKVRLPVGKYAQVRVHSKDSRGESHESRAEFPELLVLKKDLPGLVLLSLAESASCGRDTCLAVSAAQALPDTGQVDHVFYDPLKGLHTFMKHKVEWIIPVGALSHPVMFAVSVRDSVGAYATVDIYPYVRLKKEATLRLGRISARAWEEADEEDADPGEGIRLKRLSDGRIEIGMKQIVPVDDGYPVIDHPLR